MERFVVNACFLTAPSASQLVGPSHVLTNEELAYLIGRAGRHGPFAGPSPWLRTQKGS
jgi:hypothetical protein